MKVLSLFTGVGGFDLGLEQAGMETVFQCEYDKNCVSILERHWPNTPRWDDVTTLTGEHILKHAPQIDVVAWGSPCQDLSVAGKRTGLEGNQSNLFHEGMRIIKELREQTNGQYPRISIWENVVGATTSNNGNDFGVILDEMAKAGAMVIEWCVLDAQYFGVPQRRRRVFVVAIFDSAIANNCPNPLLPVAESLPRNFKKGNPQRQSSAKETSNSVREDGGNQPILIDRAAFNQGVNALYDVYISDQPVIPSLVARGPHAVYPSNPVTPLAFDTQFGSNANITEDVSLTLKSTQQSPSVAFYDGYNQKLDESGVHRSLRIGRDSSDFILQPAEQTMAVRRLTPLECERLMGWPDDYTRYKADGTEQADTNRYKQCGNGVASPVAAWIGKQVIKL